MLTYFTSNSDASLLLWYIESTKWIDQQTVRLHSFLYPLLCEIRSNVQCVTVILHYVKPHRQCNSTEHHIQDVLRTKTPQITKWTPNTQGPALEHRPHNWARRHHASGRTPKFRYTKHTPKKPPTLCKTRSRLPHPPLLQINRTLPKAFFLSENPKGSNLKMATCRNM
jgi:hypothetical protein